MEALGSVTPEETWSGRPYIAHMRVFRSIVYAMVLDDKRDKLDAK